MCQTISGVSVYAGDSVTVYTLPDSDSHTDIRVRRLGVQVRRRSPPGLVDRGYDRQCYQAAYQGIPGTMGR